MISLSCILGRGLKQLPKLKLGIAGLFLGLELVGCGYWFPSTNLTAVSEVQQMSSQTDVIYLKGQVRQVVNLLEEGAYQLQDSTGKIWVITSAPLPQPGDEILIKGQPRYERIPIGQFELGEVYVTELERLRSSSSTLVKPQRRVNLPAPTYVN